MIILRHDRGGTTTTLKFNITSSIESVEKQQL